MLAGGGVGGASISENTALQVAAVYGSVGVIADSVGTLPLERWSSTEPATMRQLDPGPLLVQPYEEISRIDWMVQYVMSMALRGNFYGHIVDRDRDLYPRQIKPIHPDQASVRRLPSSGRVEYRFNGRPVPIDDVFHIRFLSTAGSLVGLNPIEYLRNTLGLARSATLYGSSFFDNSAIPSGVIEVEDELDEDETLAMARAWMEAHQGVGKANLPAVLTAGAKFNAINLTPEDAQFIGSRQFSQGEISGMIFRVPPHMIGIVDRSTSWGRGIEQQERGFVTNTLAGYIGRLEETLTALHPGPQVVRFNLSHRLRGAKLERYQAYSLGALGGWLCADDIRAEEGMRPVPDGQGKTFMVPINSEPLAVALKQTLEASAGADAADDLEIQSSNGRAHVAGEAT